MNTEKMMTISIEWTTIKESVDGTIQHQFHQLNSFVQR